VPSEALCKMYKTLNFFFLNAKTIPFWQQHDSKGGKNVPQKELTLQPPRYLQWEIKVNTGPRNNLHLDVTFETVGRCFIFLLRVNGAPYRH
jgi:hypothetical protein